MKSAPAKNTPARNTRGITLIELVVAMAVFALISVLGLQALSGSLRTREALTQRAEASAELARTLALLRQDLDAALPMSFYPPGAARGASAILETGSRFALSRSGVTGPDGRARLGRVDWTLEDGRLSRQSWATLTPLNPGQQSPAMPVMEGVLALDWRSYWRPNGWTPGLRPPRQPSGIQSTQTGQPPETFGQDQAGPQAFSAYASPMPEAVELTLITRDFGAVVLVERLK